MAKHKHIPTWGERCDKHPDHAGIVTHGMIQARMQEEIDDLRAELENCHAKYRELFAAAQNLCKVKGRHHSEIAMRRLMEVCGVERPNVK